MTVDVDEDQIIELGPVGDIDFSLKQFGLEFLFCQSLRSTFCLRVI